MSNDYQPKRILRRPEVERLTGLGRSTIYLRMSQDTFPKSVPLGGRLVGWKFSDVQQWIDDCIANAEKAA
jgi:prophage regulatory protein